jgi:hypothetical protein
MPSPRSQILTSVPRMWQTHLEIAKAIRALTAQDREHQIHRQTEFAVADDDYAALIKEIVCEILLELRKAGYRQDQPRWPKGSGDVSGRWSGGAGEGPPAPPKPPPEDLKPGSWSIGHNQGPPLDDPPDIPAAKPEEESEIWDFAKAAAKWLGRAGVRRVLEIGLEATVGGPVGDFLLAMEAAYWLYQYLPYIRAYLDPPKTWEELQQNQGPGYDNHHVVEQWSRNDGISDEVIDADDNQVRIPTLKHWDVNGWLDTPNPEYEDSEGNSISPRQYMRGKSLEERRRIGIEALVKFGVLKP